MLGRIAVAMGLAAAAPSWQVLDNNFDTIILAVAFADTKNGVVPYDDNGSGPGVKVTTDGGKTWTHGTPTKYTSLLMDAAYVGKNVVVGGTFDTQFSVDGGSNFNVSKGDKLVGQSCESIIGLTDDKFFGITGADIKNLNGVAISEDGGASVKFINISIAQTLTRYGAFPSRNTWYIAAGTFPQAPTPSVGKRVTHRVSRRVQHEVDLKTGKRSMKLNRASANPNLDPPVGWSGELLKTTDGGKTWRSQFWTTDFYFNGIDCLDENRCCAVGEADQGSAAGARIMCTTDGQTWNQVYFAAGASYSLLGIRAVHGSSPGEWWAGGGNLPSQFDITGMFPHSIDGGKTWTVETLKKVYVTDLTIVDATHAWGSTLEEDEQSGLVIYA